MLEIEIVESNIIEGGIEVFARAWRDGIQIGFGKDGTVDIERFRIFNPPILVSDPNGTIENRRIVDDDPLTGEKFIEIERFREDPEEALLQVLEHNISVMKNIHGPEKIIEGKIGKTTSTFYPSAGSVSPMDMDLEGGRYTDTGSNTWANAYGDDGVVTGITDKTTQQTQATLQARLRSWTNSNGWLLIYRNTMGFATSSIPDSDTISSATLSLYVTNKADNFSQSVVVDKHTPTNESDIPLTDYATARFASVDQCSRATIASISTGAYKDFILNSTGRGNISKTGNSYFGIRCSGDMDNIAPTWSSNLSAQLLWSSADNTGTTQDPKLVVEHAAGATSNIKSIAGVLQADIKSVAGVLNADIKSIAGVTNS